MDKLFLSGLSGKDVRKGGALPARLESSATNLCSASALYSCSTGAATSTALAGIGAVTCTPYGGRPPEQLLFDVATCDLVLLVSDEIMYSRAVPLHKDVLRTRNVGGYFARVLADPSSFPEYSDLPAGPGADVASGPLATKPMIRRMHWPWPLASALVTFLYRDSCEVPWEQLAALRRTAEEVGMRGLMDAVDYLLDPQHLLPWTLADMRAAAVALRRHQLVEAADKYAAAMKAAGVDEMTRMTAFVYHPRQMHPKFATSVSAPPSLPAIDAAPHDAAAGVLAHSSSFSCPHSGSGPGAAAASLSALGTGSGSFSGGSGSSSCHRDSRLGLDLVDGVLRSVALGSKVLRGLLQPGRRAESVLVCGGVQWGPPSGAGTGPGARPRRVSNLQLSSGCSSGSSPNLLSPTGASSGGSGIALRPSSPYSALAAGGGGLMRRTGSFSSAMVPPGPGVRGATELPQLGARIRTAMGMGAGGGAAAGAGAGGGGSALGTVSRANSFSCGAIAGGAAVRTYVAGGAGGGGGTVSGGTVSSTVSGGVEEPPEPCGALELMVIVPASNIGASLASLVARPLESHSAGYTGPLGGPAAEASLPVPGLSKNKKEGDARSGLSSFNPFSRLSGVPGLSWTTGNKSASCKGDSSSSDAPHVSPAAAPSLLQQLPPASSLGTSDQISLALALDCTGGGALIGDSCIAFTAAAAAAVAMAGGPATPASRLLGSVLSTLAAMDHAQFVVKMDPAAVAQAVAFERRRAAVDLSSINGIAEAIVSSGTGPGGGSFTSACAAAASGVKMVLGPANPRDYYIPLPDNPDGAIAITLPVGLTLLDPATLEALAAAGCMEAGPPPSSAASSSLGGSGTSARVAALMSHLVAAGVGLSHVVAAVGVISQVLRVASEQYGVFSVPAMRASLRIANPSQAMLTVLSQTNTHFAVEPLSNTIFVRKAPGDIVRLLQALNSTLPVKGCNGSGNVAGGVIGNGDSFSVATAGRARLGNGEFITGGPRQNSMRTRMSLDIASRPATTSGFVNGGPTRRATNSEFNFRASITSGGMPSYTYGTPYSQLDRLFPGWHTHVVEIFPPGVMLEEF